VYVCGNMNDILKMPIDLNCLNQELLSELSNMLTVDVLDELNDRKDKLVRYEIFNHIWLFW